MRQKISTELEKQIEFQAKEEDENYRREHDVFRACQIKESEN